MAHQEENSGAKESSQSKLFLLFVLGVFMIFVGIVIVVAAMIYGGQSSFGGVIFIGPFPIVIGAGPNATWLVLVSLVIAALSIVVSLILRRHHVDYSN